MDRSDLRGGELTANSAQVDLACRTIVAAMYDRGLLTHEILAQIASTLDVSVTALSSAIGEAHGVYAKSKTRSVLGGMLGISLEGPDRERAAAGVLLADTETSGSAIFINGELLCKFDVDETPGSFGLLLSQNLSRFLALPFSQLLIQPRSENWASDVDAQLQLFETGQECCH